jgi:uncharacterized SAM-binding protein YcdF (DUF218 family)
VTAAVRSLVSESGFILLTLVFGLWLASRPASRGARRGLLITAIIYGCASVYAASYPFEQLLSIGYRPLTRDDVPAGRTAIVVLGSGSFTARDWDRGEYSIIDKGAAERVREATRILWLIDANWVIASGGPIDSSDSNVPTAIAMRAALNDLGVPATRLLALPGASDTFEEAVALGPFLEQLGAEHVVLVTSRRHMRRSIGAFRAVGITAIPAVARNSFLDRPWREWWLPRREGLDEAHAVVHEYLGIVGYAARGRYKF